MDILDNLYRLSDYTFLWYSKIYTLVEQDGIDEEEYNKYISLLKKLNIAFKEECKKLKITAELIDFLREKVDKSQSGERIRWKRIMYYVILEYIEKNELENGIIYRMFMRDVTNMAISIAYNEIDDLDLAGIAIAEYFNNLDLEDIFLENKYLFTEHPFLIYENTKYLFKDNDYEIALKRLYIDKFKMYVQTLLSISDDLVAKQGLSGVIYMQAKLRAIIVIVDEETRYELEHIAKTLIAKKENANNTLAVEKINEAFSYLDKDKEIPQYVHVRRK